MYMPFLLLSVSLVLDYYSPLLMSELYNLGSSREIQVRFPFTYYFLFIILFEIVS